MSQSISKSAHIQGTLVSCEVTAPPDIMQQALSSSARAEDASHVEVPAKDASEHVLDGSKDVKLMNPISPAKHAVIVDDQLPSLFSMAIDGLPPLQQAKYVDEVEKYLHSHYVECYPHVTSFSSYCRAGLSVASYLHPGVISMDRLVAISFNYAVLFMIDDLFFDTPIEFHREQYGINQSAFKTTQSMEENILHLDAIFSQKVKPHNPAPLVETLLWESGHNMLQLSNREWFDHYVAAVVEHHRAGLASHADIVEGRNICFNDLESYAIMRAANVGGRFVQTAIEFTNDSYIPNALRATPYFQNLTMVASIHVGFANDVCSYHKESLIEENPRNLITVLMEIEGKPFAETLQMAIDLTNTYALAFMDLEAKAWNSTLQKHFQDVKDLVGGNIYFGCFDDRYRHSDSIFPELRDTTSSWKIHLHIKKLKGNLQESDIGCATEDMNFILWFA